ncbi:MAG TPA: hypothetical protein VG737_15600 [Cyclobacteriaceae bacterium]|nr:hypothetical protein [Cyclobacteriaceae bacterium]
MSATLSILSWVQRGLAALALVCLTVVLTHGQDAAPEKRHRNSVYLGVGPNYYFNNLVALKNEVNEFNYSFVARYMWEPEHLLSIGFETGYYRLYNIKLNGANHTSIRNSAIPFQLVLGTRFLKNYYFNFAIGRSLLINDITTDADGDFDASALSLADFSTTVGYKKRLNDRFSLSSELKWYYASKASDMNLALAFVVGYGFK